MLVNVGSAAPEPRSVMKMNAADESRETLRGFYK